MRFLWEQLRCLSRCVDTKQTNRDYDIVRLLVRSEVRLSMAEVGACVTMMIGQCQPLPAHCHGASASGSLREGTWHVRKTSLCLLHLSRASLLFRHSRAACRVRRHVKIPSSLGVGAIRIQSTYTKPASPASCTRAPRLLPTKRAQHYIATYTPSISGLRNRLNLLQVSRQTSSSIAASPKVTVVTSAEASA